MERKNRERQKRQPTPTNTTHRCMSILPHPQEEGMVTNAGDPSMGMLGHKLPRFLSLFFFFVSIPVMLLKRKDGDGRFGHSDGTLLAKVFSFYFDL